mgnify:CR=1 FL=1
MGAGDQHLQAAHGDRGAPPVGEDSGGAGDDPVALEVDVPEDGDDRLEDSGLAGIGDEDTATIGHNFEAVIADLEDVLALADLTCVIEQGHVQAWAAFE